MFSQEQIKEIQYKLGLLGMKDTAFPVVSNLNASDTITLVQDAVNKRANIKQLAEAIPVYNPDIMTGTKDRDIYIIGKNKSYTWNSRISISSDDIEEMIEAHGNHKLLAIKINNSVYPLSIKDWADPDFEFIVITSNSTEYSMIPPLHTIRYGEINISREEMTISIYERENRSDEILNLYLRVDRYNTDKDVLIDRIQDLEYASIKQFYNTAFNVGDQYQIPSQYIGALAQDLANETKYEIVIVDQVFPFYPKIETYDAVQGHHFSYFIISDITSDSIKGYRCTYDSENNDTFYISEETIPLASESGITEIPIATANALGGICVGFTQTGKKYPVQLSAKKAYVEVPWENTTYTFTPINPTLSWGSTSVLGKVGDLEFKATMPANPFPYTLGYTQSGKTYPVLQSDGKLYVHVPWTDNNTTYTKATTSADGLMSKEDKAKLDTYNPTLYTLKKTQAEYNALESAGTLDANTIYFIVG